MRNHVKQTYISKCSVRSWLRQPSPYDVRNKRQQWECWSRSVSTHSRMHLSRMLPDWMPDPTTMNVHLQTRMCNYDSGKHPYRYQVVPKVLDYTSLELSRKIPGKEVCLVPPKFPPTLVWSIGFNRYDWMSRFLI